MRVTHFYVVHVRDNDFRERRKIQIEDQYKIGKVGAAMPGEKS